MPAILELEEAYERIAGRRDFHEELGKLLKDYAGRPTPLFFAGRLTAKLGGVRIYLKREDLAHTGAHKINNTLGQALLARWMGKRKVIAETGAGQHGVATATVCALFGFDCVVYMGEEDVHRQALNVFRMELLGAKCIPVTSGSRTLKDAINEAMRDWVTNVRDTHYIIGTCMGPHPYPTLVRDFQSVIGRETRRQMLEIEGKLPDYVVACVGGGSNAIGIFNGFIPDKAVQLIGVEGGGKGIPTGHHCATLCVGTVGVLHGARTYLLQDENGQIHETECISAGLDYPGVGPEHSYLKDIGRAQYVNVSDEQVLDAFFQLTRLEGILPALESAHALAWVSEQKGKYPRETVVVVNLSGRGDKDIGIVEQHRPLNK